MCSSAVTTSAFINFSSQRIVIRTKAVMNICSKGLHAVHAALHTKTSLNASSTPRPCGCSTTGIQVFYDSSPCMNRFFVNLKRERELAMIAVWNHLDTTSPS